MEKAEQERGKIYDVVLIVRYDLTFEEFFWTEAGAKSQCCIWFDVSATDGVQGDW